MISIAVCIASFNRREHTLSCLERLFAAELPDNARVAVHLLDDGSGDGTAEAVAETFPQVCLHHGDGNCFWAGGMRVAFGAAREEQHDFYIWLNDDVVLFPDTILRAWQTYTDLTWREHVIIGANASATGHEHIADSERASHLLPWKFRSVDPLSDACLECDTTNGNFIFSAATSDRVGNINPAFVQMHADIVFGLLARKTGARLWLMAGFAGLCEANIGGGRIGSLPASKNTVERSHMMEHPLGYPLCPSIAYAKNFRSLGARHDRGALCQSAAGSPKRALRAWTRSAPEMRTQSVRNIEFYLWAKKDHTLQ